MSKTNLMSHTTSNFISKFKRSLNVRDCVAKLGPKQPFIHFDLKLTDEERIVWAKLSVKKASGYRNFGDLQHLHDQVKEHLQSLGNDEELSNLVASSIDSLVYEIVSQFSEESALIVIGSSLPNKYFDVPRWHADGYYVAPYAGAQFKVVIVLKGPHTLFYNLPNELRDQFRKLQELNVDMFDLNHRSERPMNDLH